MLARFAALVARTHRLPYLLNLGIAGEVGIEAEDVRGVLAAIAPIVGTARVAADAATSSAPRAGDRRRRARSGRRDLLGPAEAAPATAWPGVTSRAGCPRALGRGDGPTAPRSTRGDERRGGRRSDDRGEQRHEPGRRVETEPPADESATLAATSPASWPSCGRAAPRRDPSPIGTPTDKPPAARRRGRRRASP